MEVWENASSTVCCYFFPGNYLEETLSSLFLSASSPCGSYHRRLYRSQVTSIDHSFGRKNEESAEEVSCCGMIVVKSQCKCVTPRKWVATGCQCVVNALYVVVNTLCHNFNLLCFFVNALNERVITYLNTVKKTSV